MTLVILVFPFWNFASFLSNGLVTGCSVTRLLGLMLGLTVLFYFFLFLCLRELKFGMVVNLLVAWYVLFPSGLEVLVGSKGSALELLDGTLKLRHCTDVFTMRFLPWSLPRVGNGGGKRQIITTGLPSEISGNTGKRARLTRKTRPGASSHVIPDPGHPTPRRWKRLRPPSSEGEGGEVGEPRNLFPRLGVG